MIKITKQGMGAAGIGSKLSCYQVAGQQLVFSETVESLNAYQCDLDISSQSSVESVLPSPVLLSAENARLQYSGEAPFANIQQSVKCWRSDHYMQIDVADTAIAWVDFKLQRIHLLNDGSFDDDLNLEVVLGPALILLLAANNCYCLHAGAVAIQGGNVAFIAESGVGKSTLSAHRDSQWCQISDDILPVYPGGAIAIGLYQIGSFPQLKLADNRVAINFKKDRALDLVLRLIAEPSDAILFTPLSGADAVLQLIRHTVAGRLFNQAEMQLHMQFAKHFSSSIPLVELRYPRDLNRLDEVRSAISAYLD